ncbi:hypothetical protein AQ875_21415 [Burkholderia pseudomallei]|nr:hypothetical protein AQ875_21415 [Burkholderia pseudomallei]
MRIGHPDPSEQTFDDFVKYGFVAGDAHKTSGEVVTEVSEDGLLIWWHESQQFMWDETTQYRSCRRDFRMASLAISIFLR